MYDFRRFSYGSIVLCGTYTLSCLFCRSGAQVPKEKKRGKLDEIDAKRLDFMRQTEKDHVNSKSWKASLAKLQREKDPERQHELEYMIKKTQLFGSS
jgi:hypothetical protein